MKSKKPKDPLAQNLTGKGIKKPTKKDSIESKAFKKAFKAKNVTEALWYFQKEAIVLPRNGVGKINAGKQYKYVTLDDLINVCRPLLDRHGLGFTQLIQGDKLNTKLFHPESSSEIESSINLGNPTGMQDYGGRVTYARRYSLTAILGLSAEEDVDAAPHSAETVPTASKATTEAFPAPAIPTTPKEAQVQRSEFFQKAKTAIESAYSPEALELIKGQVDRSIRLSDVEKTDLKSLVEARETEIEETVR